MKEARYYVNKKEEVRCLLCPQACRLQERETGLCRARKAEGQKLYTLNYGRVGAMALDPIEKKPLYHFYPGSQIFSLGTFGCNLDCCFCQNWQLVRSEGRGTTFLAPRELARLLLENPLLKEQLGVAYTYGEPSVWFEYVSEAAPLVKEQGFKNVMVTNGYINPAPLADLLPFIDALNIDVKGFSEDFYRHYLKGSLKPVLKTVEKAVEKSHVEITCLLVPGGNDSSREIESLARWLGELNRNIPLHFSRYFPNHCLDIPPTPPAVLIRARELALEHLNYVYIGNLLGHDGMDTFCPGCSRLLISRKGGFSQVLLTGEHCPSCGYQVGNAFLFFPRQQD